MAQGIVSQLAVEVIQFPTNPTVDVSQLAVEIIRSNVNKQISLNANIITFSAPVVKIISTIKVSSTAITSAAPTTEIFPGEVVLSRPATKITSFAPTISLARVCLADTNKLTFLAPTATLDITDIINSYLVYVPSPGKVWVSMETSERGEIWEYDTNGTHLTRSRIAILTHPDGYIQAAYSMAKIGTNLYYYSSGPADSAPGIYVHNLITQESSTRLIDLTGTDAYYFAVTTSVPNELLVLIPTNEIRKYSITGELLATYTVSLEFEPTFVGIQFVPEASGSFISQQNAVWLLLHSTDESDELQLVYVELPNNNEDATLSGTLYPMGVENVFPNGLAQIYPYYD